MAEDFTHCRHHDSGGGQPEKSDRGSHSGSFFAKVGSFCAARENFRLTAEVKRKFTEGLRVRTPGRSARERVMRQDGLKLLFAEGSRVRLSSLFRSARELEKLQAAAKPPPSRRQAMDIRIKLPKIRILQAPGTWLRMRTLGHGARRAGAWAGKASRRLGPMLETLYAIRRRLATGAVAILAVWLFVHALSGANGFAAYRAKRAEYRSLETEIDRLAKENDEYTKQVNELKTDPRRIEKEAREQFHYARPGEVIYVAPEPAAPERPQNRSARR